MHVSRCLCRCHGHEGRAATTGPDVSMLGGATAVACDSGQVKHPKSWSETHQALLPLQRSRLCLSPRCLLVLAVRVVGVTPACFNTDGPSAFCLPFVTHFIYCTAQQAFYLSDRALHLSDMKASPA